MLYHRENCRFIRCLPTFLQHDYQSIAIIGIKQHRLIYAVLLVVFNIINTKIKNPDRKTVCKLEAFYNQVHSNFTEDKK
jgi:hypothetical protein